LLRLSILIMAATQFSLVVLVQAKERLALVAHGGVGNPFWNVVFNGAKQAGKDLGVDVQILVPNKDADQAGTTQKLSEALTTNPDGIAVTLATKAHCDLIKEARKKNIPLLIYNAQAVASGESCPYQAYIGMDEYLAGKLSAERALSTGMVKHRAVVAITESGHSGLQARAKGITEVLKAKKIIVDVVDLGADPAGMPTRLRGHYEKNKSSLSSVFIPSPNGLHAAIRMKQEDPNGFGKVYVAGFDLTPLIVKGVEDGLIEHSVDQQPYLQGYYAISQLVLAKRGHFNPVNMNTGVGFVDKGNAAAVSELVKKQIR
jgi:simple sugar transport system substrate-binding protein